ncbi:hypothetical protein IF1G_11361 [Cordyceps javanica]|uniref:Uncharacterized protein n=1 Tax=Cordyceps javanica TaxID=43265 RepID=A0A545VI76_9HYPO|nr:hypothetical protein IF1G_11361 [Cordyceps javanica]TQW01431.1 hypothetical protein IF2G_11052 [Cordyceps javanica]
MPRRTVSIKAKTTRSGLDDTFDGDDIPWSKVDQHLGSLGLLFKLRRMQITVMVDLTYYETSTKAATGAKRRKTATSKAREKLPSDAVFMTRFYKHHECNGICRNKSMHCLKYKDGNYHPIDLETMRASCDAIKQRVGEDENSRMCKILKFRNGFIVEFLLTARNARRTVTSTAAIARPTPTGEMGIVSA